MAQFDVHLLAGDAGLVVDVQSDLLDPLNTRVVVPLMRPERAPKPARRLNPVLEIDGQDYVLVTQFLSAVRSSDLGPATTNLHKDRDAVTAALDMVFQGF